MKTIKKLEIRARRVQVSEESVPYGTPVTDPKNAMVLARSILDGEDQEVFIVLLLDVKNKVLGFTEVARGGIDGCPVDPKVVFRAAVLVGASSILVAHCHPSGDPQPSREDIELTEQLIKAGKTLNLPVLDHIIVGHDAHISFAERGLMSVSTVQTKP